MNSNLNVSSNQFHPTNIHTQKTQPPISNQDQKISSAALKTLQEKEQVISKQIDSLNHNIQQLHEERISLQSRVTDITKQTSKIKVEKERAQLAITQLRKKLDNIQIKINQITYNARENKTSQEPIAKSIDSIQKQLDTGKTNLEERKASLETEKAKKKKTSVELEQLNSKVRELTQELEETTKQYNNQIDISTELSDLIERANKELVETCDQIVTLEKELNSKNDQYDTENRELIDNAQRINVLSERIKALNENASGKSIRAQWNKFKNILPRSELRKAKKDLEAARDKVKQLDKTVKFLKEEVTSLEVHLEATKGLESSKRTAITTLTFENEQTEQNIGQLSSTIDKLSPEKTKKEEEEARSKNSEIREIQNSIAQHEKEVISIESKLSTLKKELSKNQDKLTELQNKHSEFEQDIRELEREKTQNTTQTSTNEKLIQQKEIELKDNELHLKETEKDLQNNESDLRNTSKQLEDLQTELRETQLAIQNELKSIQDKIDEEKKIRENAHQALNSRSSPSIPKKDPKTTTQAINTAFKKTTNNKTDTSQPTSGVRQAQSATKEEQKPVQATPPNLTFEQKYTLHLTRMQEVIDGKKLSVDDNRQVVTAERSKTVLGSLRAGKSENAQKSLEAELHELQSLIQEVKNQGSNQQKTTLKKTISDFLRNKWVSKTLESSSKLQTAAQEVLNEAENVNIFDQTFKLRVLNKLISENSGSESEYIQWNEKTNTPEISKRLSDKSTTKAILYVQDAIETEIERLEQLSTRTDLEWEQLSTKWKSEKKLSPQEIKIKYIEEEISSLSTLITNLEKKISKGAREKTTPNSQIITQTINNRFNSLIDQAMAQRDKCMEELRGSFTDGNIQSYTLTKNDFDNIEKNIINKNNELKPEEQLNAEELAKKITSKKREPFYPLYEIGQNEQTYANGLTELYKTLKDQYEQLQKTPGNDELKQTFKRLFLGPLEPLVPLAQHSSTLMNEALPQKPTDFTGTSSEWIQKVIDEKLGGVDLSKFQKVAQSFKDITGPLGTYSSLYNEQLEFITEMKKVSQGDSELKTWASGFVQVMSKKTISGADGNKTSPTSWLIAPVQRATRYKMTLVEAAKSAANVPNLKTAIDSWCTPAGVLAEIANHVTGKQELSKCKYNASIA